GKDVKEIPEQNVKLSRAMLIVLRVHVAAVSAIIAFNEIKTRESSFVPQSSTNAEPKPSATVSAVIHADGAKPQTAVVQKENPPREDLKPSHSSSKLSSKDDHATAPSVAKAAAAKPVPSGKTYVVKKGDNPVTIARKLKVPYNDLIALNHIEDARKVLIGQKLLIPKPTRSKTKNEKAANPRKNEVRHTKQQARST